MKKTSWFCIVTIILCIIVLLVPHLAYRTMSYQLIHEQGDASLLDQVELNTTVSIAGGQNSYRINIKHGTLSYKHAEFEEYIGFELPRIVYDFEITDEQKAALTFETVETGMTYFDGENVQPCKQRQAHIDQASVNFTIYPPDEAYVNPEANTFYTNANVSTKLTIFNAEENPLLFVKGRCSTYVEEEDSGRVEQLYSYEDTNTKSLGDDMYITTPRIDRNMEGTSSVYLLTKKEQAQKGESGETLYALEATAIYDFAVNRDTTVKFHVQDGIANLLIGDDHKTRLVQMDEEGTVLHEVTKDLPLNEFARIDDGTYAIFYTIDQALIYDWRSWELVDEVALSSLAYLTICDFHYEDGKLYIVWIPQRMEYYYGIPANPRITILKQNNILYEGILHLFDDTLESDVHDAEPSWFEATFVR